MNLVVAFDGRFTNYNGRPCSHHLNYDSFSRRYLDIFQEVCIVGRFYSQDNSEGMPVDGDRVSFLGVPGYVGPLQFIYNVLKILAILYRVSGMDARFILRTPGTVPFILSLFLVLRRKRFSVEVVADPYDQLSKGANSSKLRAVFRYLYVALLKWQCRVSFSAAYVTDSALQKRYPPGSDFNYSYTSLNLSKDWFVYRPKIYKDSFEREIKIISVGMMTQSYKGFDTLIAAVSELKLRGRKVLVHIVGDGELREDYEEMVRSLSMENEIIFSGRVERGQELKNLFDHSDLFVLASRQEGLPRAMIEAMSRGLPCIGTNVGGIPELVNEDFLVDSDSPSQLSKMIERVASNESLYNSLSSACLINSKKYSQEFVQVERNRHYRKILESQ